MTAQTLPVDIVARATALGEAIQAHAQTHRAAALSEHEGALRGLVQAALPELLGGVLSVALLGGTPGRASAPQPCPSCGQPSGVQSWRGRQVATTCGDVRYERPWYHCRACQHGWAAFDQPLGVAAQARTSPALRDWLVHLGATTSFAEGADLLGTLTGLWVAPETLRQQTEAVGAALAVAETTAIQQVAATGEAAEPVAAAPGQLVVEVDGCKLGYRAATGELSAKGRPRWRTAWHEVKVGVVGGQATPDAAVTAKSYVAAQEPAEAFGLRLVAEAARRGALDIVGWTGPRLGRGLALLRTVLVLGDGAPWIWALMALHFGQRIEILDWYHAAEHLWVVASALFGQGTDTAHAWAKARLHDLRHHGPAPVQRALRRAKAPTPTAAETLRLGRDYVRTNAARMAYPTFAAAGFPLGSGAVEGGGKCLVQQRLKRAGMRWSPDGAHAVLTVRCRLLSHRPLAA